MEDQRPSCGQGSASQCLSFVFEKGMRSASDLFEPSLNAFASEKLLIHSRISKCFSLCLEVFRKKCINELKPLSVVFYVFLSISFHATQNPPDVINAKLHRRVTISRSNRKKCTIFSCKRPEVTGLNVFCFVS